MDGGVGERRQWHIDRGGKEMGTAVVRKGGGEREKDGWSTLHVGPCWARVTGKPPKLG